MNDPEVTRVGLMVANEVSMPDIANVFETEGLLEYMYALTSVGDDLSTVAQDLRIPISKIKLIMKSSPQRRKRFMEAKVSELADNSLATLAAFNNAVGMDREEKNAASHHLSVVDTAQKLVTNNDAGEVGPKVVVNNNVVIGENQSPPPLPPELKGIVIEHEPST